MELLILVIIVSVVSNIIKEKKKQAERRAGRTESPFEKPRVNPLPENRPVQRKQAAVQGGSSPSYMPPVPRNDSVPTIGNTIEEIGRQLFEEDFSLEGKRNDIRETYESGGDAEGIHISHESTGHKIGERDYSKGFERVYEPTQMVVNLDRDSLINGIILSEALSPPKCRR